MDPRLSTSRKWSPLPKELLQQIRTVFKQNFKEQLGTGTVEASGKIYPDEILVQVGVRQAKALKQSNFVVSITYKAKKDNVIQLLHLAVDASASLFEQFFASADDSEFPRAWEEVDFEGRKIYVIYSTVNSKLEAEADALLGKSKAAPAEAVAQGDWEDEEVDPELIKAHLGLTDDDET